MRRFKNKMRKIRVNVGINNDIYNQFTKYADPM